MKTQIIGVERNQFTNNETGELVSYTKVSLLEPKIKSVDNIGFNVVEYTTKYDNFDKLSNLYKNNKDVEVEFEYRQIGRSANYKKKIKKIDDITL